MKNLVYILIIMVLMCVCMLQHNQIRKIEKYDTIRVDSMIIRSTDTIVRVDTMLFPLPVVQYVKADESKKAVAITDEKKDTMVWESKVYKDSTYTAHVSGYFASLDSIEVYNKNTFIHDSTYVLKVVTVKEKPKKWHFGPSVGITLGGGRIEPSVGVSLSYSIFSF